MPVEEVVLVAAEDAVVVAVGDGTDVAVAEDTEIIGQLNHGTVNVLKF